MLRLIVLALVLANMGYFAWSHHLLRDLRIGPSEEAEPHRMAQQIRPDVLRIVRTAGTGDLPAPPQAAPPQSPEPAPPAPAPATVPVPVSVPVVPASTASAASSSTPTPTACLQAGIFDSDQAETLRRTLSKKLPTGSWSLNKVSQPGRWMVYMGRFTDNETLNKKRNELKARNVSFERPGVAALEPGLTLGRFATEDAAERALVKLNTRGVRSARVVQEREETPGFVLRLPAADADTIAQLRAMRRVLGDKNLRSCI